MIRTQSLSVNSALSEQERKKAEPNEKPNLAKGACAEVAINKQINDDRLVIQRVHKLNRMSSATHMN